MANAANHDEELRRGHLATGPEWHGKALGFVGEAELRRPAELRLRFAAVYKKCRFTDDADKESHDAATLLQKAKAVMS